jgi:hypothetical protein
MNTYLGLAVALAVVALIVWLNRNRLKGEHHGRSSALASLSLLKSPASLSVLFRPSSMSGRKCQSARWSSTMYSSKAYWAPR